MNIGHIFINHKQRGNKRIIYILGLPAYIKKYDKTHAYYSLFGIRFLKKQKTAPGESIQILDVPLNSNELNIAVLLQGGLGDMLINANFIHLLRQKIGYNNIRIDIYNKRTTDILDSVFAGHKIANNIYKGAYPQNSAYDLTIELSRFPILQNVNHRRILFASPELFEFVQLWEKDNIEKHRFIDFNPFLDGFINKYFLLKGFKRWEQFDIDHKLGMTEKFPFKLNINIPEQEYLKGLKIPTKFITIHRGVDNLIGENSVKQWPVEYYNKLIKMIREKYPNIYIVQLGDSTARCSEFDGVDLNLCGETNIEQLKVLLKHSALHIDGEGGMVHLRHALNGGKSIVLFGPTDPKVYGYTENINLVGRGCPGGCEWIRENWQEECSLYDGFPPCQYSLTPDVVFKSFAKAWDKIK